MFGRNQENSPAAGHSLSLALVCSLLLHGSAFAALAWWQAPRAEVPPTVIAVDWVSDFAASGDQTPGSVNAAGEKEPSVTTSSRPVTPTRRREVVLASHEARATESDSLPPAPAADNPPVPMPAAKPQTAEVPAAMAFLPPLPRRKPHITPPAEPQNTHTQNPVVPAPSKSAGTQQVAYTASGQSGNDGSAAIRSRGSSATAGATNARFEGPGLANPTPSYPRAARRRGLEGKLVVRAQVSPLGRARAVWVERSSGHEILDSAALDAIKGWQFIPATLAGLPVESLVDVPVTYYLQ